MKVLALTRYGDRGGSSRVRVMQYIPLLAQAGIAVDVQPLFSNADLAALYRTGRRSAGSLTAAFSRRMGALLKASRADVVWMQQEVFPFLPYMVESALLGRRRLVADYDDASQLYYQQHPNALARALYAGKIGRIMARADAVTVGSPVMETYARGAGAKNVHLVHSAVDCARFTDIAGMPPPAFAVGWIGTPMTAAQSLHILKAPLVQFLRETGTACLLMGMDAGQFPEIPAERIPWSEGAEPGFMTRLSVGLCPLDDTGWTRGKSGYKIIQYMAAGRPVLTSPVAIAGDIVVPGETGFHCASEDDWYRGLTQLHADAALRAALGARGRALAETRYDINVAAEQLRSILRG